MESNDSTSTNFGLILAWTTTPNGYQIGHNLLLARHWLSCLVHSRTFDQRNGANT